MDIKETVLKELRKQKLLAKTQFVILFGSVPAGKANPLSDIDICVSLSLPPKERLQARIALSGALPEKYDLQIFEDLPLYVQKEVFKGEVLYCRKREEVVEQALQTIREYEDFEHIYLGYITKRVEA